MSLLDRYLFRVVVASSLIVLLALLVLDAAFALITELDDVGEGEYRLLDAVVYVLLTLPRRAYALFSTAVLLGSLIGLGTLASNSELVVMRAAGISNLRILRAVVQVGVLLSVLTFLLGEWVAPASEQRAQQLRADRLSGRVSLKAEDGLWVKDGERFVNIKQLLPGLHLRDITVYEFGPEGLERATSALRGWYAQGRWTLEEVRRSELGEQAVTTRSQAREVWPRLVDPALFDVLLVPPDSLSIVNLHRYVAHLQRNELDAGRYELAFWRKLASPVATLVMLLMAVPFVFGAQRSAGAGQRLLLGSVIGIVFFLADRLASHAGLIYGVPPVLSAFAPTLLFATGLAVLLRRVL